VLKYEERFGILKKQIYLCIVNETITNKAQRLKQNLKLIAISALLDKDIFGRYQRRTASNGRCGQMGTKFVLSVSLR
jgi:hypothetical protein